MPPNPLLLWPPLAGLRRKLRQVWSLNLHIAWLQMYPEPETLQVVWHKHNDPCAAQCCIVCFYFSSFIYSWKPRLICGDVTNIVFSKCYTAIAIVFNHIKYCTYVLSTTLVHHWSTIGLMFLFAGCSLYLWVASCIIYFCANNMEFDLITWNRFPQYFIFNPRSAKS